MKYHQLGKMSKVKYNFLSKIEIIKSSIMIKTVLCIDFDNFSSEKVVKNYLAILWWDKALLSYMIYSTLFMPPFRECGAVFQRSQTLKFLFSKKSRSVKNKS